MNKQRIMIFLLSCLSFSLSSAEPSNELIYQLKASISKIHSVNAHGGQSTGSGVVVAENMVATNCHTLADSVGMNIAALGETYQPVGLKADWKHDICILRFEFLPLKPITFSQVAPHYEQATFSIGFPGGPPKPITTFGRVKGLYEMDGSSVIRTNGSFQLGASGSPLFDEEGKLIGMSTFKSPGRNAFYYHVPAKWIQLAMQLPDTAPNQFQAPFWDTPEEKRPYWMQVVTPLQNEQWSILKSISEQWVAHEKDNPEAHYYLGMAQMNLGEKAAAKINFQTALILNKAHCASMLALAQMAQQEGNQQAFKGYQQMLAELNSDELENLEIAK
jgi:serine protease Do